MTASFRPSRLLSKLFFRQAALSHSAPADRRLRLESLEERRLLTVFHVGPDALGSQDGLGWDTAYDSLQSALDVAVAGDEIWVADGTYIPTAKPDPYDERSAIFSLVDGVDVYGSFAGTETLISQRPTNPDGTFVHETILSGDLGLLTPEVDDDDAADIPVANLLTHVTRSDNAYTVVYCGTNIEVTLDGLSIIGGNANIDSGAVSDRTAGGGIFNLGTLVFNNGTLSRNSAQIQGGGIVNFGGALTLTNSILSYNLVNHYGGGGICNDSGTVTVSESVVSENVANFFGGGIYNSGTLAITDSTLLGNSAVRDGGGICNWGSLAVTNSTLSDNSAVDNGGGIVNGGTLMLSNSTLSDNTADNGGGISTGGTVTITNTTLLSNLAVDNGGGIYNSGSLAVTNSTLSDNSAVDNGGGIYNLQDGTVTVTNSSLSNNSTTGLGGGIYNRDNMLTLNNSIVAENTAPTGPDVRNFGGIITGSNNLIGDGSGQTYLEHGAEGNLVGTDVAPIDPEFVDPANGDYHLLSSSPAIDAGSDSLLNESNVGVDFNGDGDTLDVIFTDLDDNPRYIDIHGSHDETQGSVDIGAYEMHIFDTYSFINGVAYVNLAAEGQNGGNNWNDAFTSLGNAIAVATYLNGDTDQNNDVAEIWVAAGTYIPTGTLNPTDWSDADHDGEIDNDDGPRSATFALVDGVSIYGGFAGTESSTTERATNADGFFINETILSGDLNGDDGTDIPLSDLRTHYSRDDNVYTVVTVKSLSSSTTIDGFTITGGNADYYSGPWTSPGESGGGLHFSYNVGGQSLQVRNSIIRTNSASDGGGVFFTCSDTSNIYGQPLFTNVTIEGNASSAEGGGVYFDHCNTVLNDVAVTGNWAYRNGGGIRIYYGSSNMSNLLISDNTADSFGAGTFTSRGGGIYQSNANVKLYNAIIKLNASPLGGGVYFYNGESSITNTLICQNSASNSGDNTVTNAGAGVYQSYGNSTLTNVTIASNSADDEGGGVYLDNGSGSARMTLRNSIVAKNTASSSGSDIAQTSISNNTLGGNNNLIGDGTGQFDLSNGNGGNQIGGSGEDAIDPMFINPEAGDYNIFLGSPAIDSGIDLLLNESEVDIDLNANYLLEGLISEDIAGNPRFTDIAGAGNEGSDFVDIGAFEAMNSNYPNFSSGIIYVDDTPGSGSNGTSWNDAMEDLESALYAAKYINNDHDPDNDVTQIWIAAGTYIPTAWSDADRDGDIDTDDGPRSATFTMVDGVSIHGGFAGTESSLEERPMNPDGSFLNETVLSGDLGLLTPEVEDDDAADIPVADLREHPTRADNAASVVTIMDITQQTIMDGLTVADGNANLDVSLWSASGKAGGGIYFFDNDASDGLLALRNLTLFENSAINGGALYLAKGTAEICTTSIHDNMAASGAGIYSAYYGTARLERSIVSGNRASGYGGGIYKHDGDMSILNSSIFGNTAARGGGLYLNYYQNGASSLSNVAIHGNTASQYGGGVYQRTGMSTMTNVTIADNSAVYRGGGIFYNEASFYLGSVLNNSIVANNITGADGPDIYQQTMVFGNNNLIGDGSWMGFGESSVNNLIGTGESPIDPLFVDSAGVDYRLQSGSPAVNAGDALQLPADEQDLDDDGNTAELIPVDLDDIARVIGANVDIGAYELDEYDFGDAPDPTFPTLLASNGARHLATGSMLGTLRDTEIDGQPTIPAHGDNLAGTSNDEDGVVNTPLLAPGIMQTPIDVQVTGTGYLNTWIDFDRSSSWEPGEQIAVDLPVVNGLNTILVDVPLTAVPGITYARLRLTSYSTAGTMLPTGLANDGEVEDYILTIDNDVYLQADPANNDTVNIWPGTPGGSQHRVQINSVDSFFDAFVYDAIYVNGLGGTDTLNVYGKSTAENAAFNGTYVHVSESSVYDVYGQGFEDIYVYGGGGTDTAQLLGSAGVDNFYANESNSYLRGNSNAFLNYVKNFATVAVDMTTFPGGTDNAYMYDSSGDDILIAGETQATLDYDSTVSPGVDVTVVGFDRVDTYGENGGDDVATLTGSSGNDTFTGLSTYAYVNGNGGAFYNYVKNFDHVTANVAVGGGTDSATLYDSPGDDTLNAGEAQAVLDHYATATPDSNLTAIGFPNVSVYALFGGDDTATLTGSSGNDKFTGRETYGRMKGNSIAFINFAKGFDTLTGDVSGTTGLDIANLYDASTDDDLVADDTSAYFDYAATGTPDPDLIATGFDQTYSYATSGGDDTSVMNGSSGVDRFTAKSTYTNLRGNSGAYFHYGTGFDESFADVTLGGGGGTDKAFIYDDTTNDSFTGVPTQATMDYNSTGSPGVDVTANGFDEVYAYADSGGTDAAVLNGSSSTTDKFYGLATYGYFKATDNSFYNYARGFDTVLANAVGSGDLAFLYGSDGNDVLIANSTSAAFTLNPTTGTPVVNTASAFDQVYSYASGGGTDKAYLNGTAGADSFIGDTDWGILRSTGTSDYFNYVRYFDEVFADPGDTDVGNDLLDDRDETYTLDTDPSNGNEW
jgi:hypothetical protein